MSEENKEVIDAENVAEESAANQASIAAKPTVSRSDLMRTMVAYATKMGPEELAGFVARIGNAEEMTKSNDEIYNSTQQANGNAAANKAGIKSSGAPAEAMPKLSVKEDLDALFGSEELSEDFRSKTEALFEAAVATRVDLLKVEIEESYEAAFNEAVEEVKSEMSENIDAYLNYAVAEYISENKLAVEQTIRTEVMESFLHGMRNLFAEHYVDIPEDKVDVVESMASKIEELEARINETTEKNIELTKKLDEAEVAKATDELSEGLTDTQKEKFAKLVEATSFSSAEEFRKKASIIKETYFSGKAEVKVEKDQLLSESVDEQETAPRLDPDMNAYVSSITRTLKK